MVFPTEAIYVIYSESALTFILIGELSFPVHTTHDEIS